MKQDLQQQTQKNHLTPSSRSSRSTITDLETITLPNFQPNTNRHQTKMPEQISKVYTELNPSPTSFFLHSELENTPCDRSNRKKKLERRTNLMMQNEKMLNQLCLFFIYTVYTERERGKKLDNCQASAARGSIGVAYCRFCPYDFFYLRFCSFVSGVGKIHRLCPLP